ncbi:CALMODULIN LIKE 25 [Hibiscus trionum]|uniref:CALMODULIN LIKE 25 n=1 Tax=Hibiscus trionum TaxID=183268 RepID=A0A9W7IXJ0_HIBTR|nr:CALMODULIN LIKE 25 [Hibiscus trionum]
MGFGSIFNRKKKRTSTNSAATSPHVQSKESLCIQSPMRSSFGNFTQTQLREIEEVFKKFDVNGDGKISASELGSILKSLGQRPSDEELDNMIREFDADGDGTLSRLSVYDIDGDGSISAEELHEVLQSLGDECSIAECRKMISGVDNDGNGMIDFEEFKVMMMAGATFGSIESNKRDVAV